MAQIENKQGIEHRVIEIQNIDEAFGYLSQEIKDHSQRVSQYAEILFNQIVAEELGAETGAGRRELIPANRKIVAEAGLYHDIGKAYLPELYQSFNVHFTAEEVAVYKKHVEDGLQLVPSIMKDFEKRKALERRLILNAIEDHHECCDGSGYPMGKMAKEISYMGQIVGLANRLDELSTKIVSETPIEDALEQMKQHDADKFNPEFFNSLYTCRGRIKRVFLSYGSTQVIRGVDTFVKRRQRPMELCYRPMVDAENNLVGYDSQMRFSNGKSNVLVYDEVKHIIAKQGIATDLGLYFVYEACDAMRRFDAYSIPSSAVTIHMMPTFFSKKSVVKGILTALEQQELGKEKLCIGVPASLFEKPTKAFLATLEAMRAAEIPMILTEPDWQGMSPADILGYGIAKVRLQATEDPEQWEQMQSWVQNASESGLQVTIDGVHRLKQRQEAHGMGAQVCAGVLVGDYESESTILAREIAVRQAEVGV